MDEQNNELFGQIKEAVQFLIEEVKALQQKNVELEEQIASVNSFMMDNIVNPSIEAYNGQRFNEFNDKYGERLGKYDDMIKTSLNDPEYSSAKEAWDTLEALPPEERDSIDEEQYVAGVEEGLTGYVDSIKQALGIPADEAVEIMDDGEGDIEVIADEDGDGVPETDVTDGEAEAEPTEEPAAEAEDSEEDGEPTQEDIDAYLNGDDLKDKE